MGITQRVIRAKQTPESGRAKVRKPFPKEVKTLGDLLRKRRTECGLTQHKVAVLLQISKSKMPAWERDETVPTAEEWMKLAEVLGLPATLAEAQPNS